MVDPVVFAGVAKDHALRKGAGEAQYGPQVARAILIGRQAKQRAEVVATGVLGVVVPHVAALQVEVAAMLQHIGLQERGLGRAGINAVVVGENAHGHKDGLVVGHVLGIGHEVGGVVAGQAQGIQQGRDHRAGGVVGVWIPHQVVAAHADHQGEGVGEGVDAARGSQYQGGHVVHRRRGIRHEAHRIGGHHLIGGDSVKGGSGIRQGYIRVLGPYHQVAGLGRHEPGVQEVQGEVGGLAGVHHAVASGIGHLVVVQFQHRGTGGKGHRRSPGIACAGHKEHLKGHGLAVGQILVHGEGEGRVHGHRIARIQGAQVLLAVGDADRGVAAGQVGRHPGGRLVAPVLGDDAQGGGFVGAQVAVIVVVVEHRAHEGHIGGVAHHLERRIGGPMVVGGNRHCKLGHGGEVQGNLGGARGVGPGGAQDGIVQGYGHQGLGHGARVVVHIHGELGRTQGHAAGVAHIQGVRHQGEHIHGRIALQVVHLKVAADGAGIAVVQVEVVLGAVHEAHDPGHGGIKPLVKHPPLEDVVFVPVGGDRRAQGGGCALVLGPQPGLHEALAHGVIARQAGVALHHGVAVRVGQVVDVADLKGRPGPAVFVAVARVDGHAPALVQGRGHRRAGAVVLKQGVGDHAVGPHDGHAVEVGAFGHLVITAVVGGHEVGLLGPVVTVGPGGGFVGQDLVHHGLELVCIGYAPAPHIEVGEVVAVVHQAVIEVGGRRARALAGEVGDPVHIAHEQHKGGRNFPGVVSVQDVIADGGVGGPGLRGGHRHGVEPHPVAPFHIGLHHRQELIGHDHQHAHGIGRDVPRPFPKGVGHQRPQKFAGKGIVVLAQRRFVGGDIGIPDVHRDLKVLQPGHPAHGIVLYREDFHQHQAVAPQTAGLGDPHVLARVKAGCVVGFLVVGKANLGVRYLGHRGLHRVQPQLLFSTAEHPVRDLH